MKKICFCFKIHIPAIPRNYRFFEIEQNHQYYNDSQVREHVKRLDANTLVPFLGMLKSLSVETGGRFKAGISISGTTLNLLQKIVPETVVKLMELAQNNCIDFFSEPWSHSIIPFIDTNLLSKEISRHNELIKVVFGSTPKVFIAHSPLGSLKQMEAAITKLNKGIFAYANHTSASLSETKQLSPKLINGNKTIFINNKVSEILQKTEFDPNQQLLAHYISQIQVRINKNIAPPCPSIIVYNPLQGNKPFNLNQIILWKKVFKRLVNFYGFQYCLPLQIIDHLKNVSHQTLRCNAKLNNYQLPNYWLTNKMQHEVLKKQLKLNDLLKQENNLAILSSWDFIQDMDNLFFIGDHFLKPKFAEYHFTPYSSPYMAYINYMNILDDMMLRVTKRITKKMSPVH